MPVTRIILELLSVPTTDEGRKEKCKGVSGDLTSVAKETLGPRIVDATEDLKNTKTSKEDAKENLKNTKEDAKENLKTVENDLKKFQGPVLVGGRRRSQRSRKTRRQHQRKRSTKKSASKKRTDKSVR